MKKLSKISITLFLPLISISFLVSCTSLEKLNDNQKKSLALYNTLLWQQSAERRIGILSSFSHATQTFLNTIKHQENQKFLDFNSVKVTWDEKECYKVKKLEYNYPQNNRFIPAVAVDLDETFLDTTMYQAFLALNHTSFTPETWRKWVLSESAPIYDGVLDFVKTVWSNNAIILLTSNRNQGENGFGDELISTRNNLIKKGYPSEFLDSQFWWMSGATQNNQDQNQKSLLEMNTKEKRYNYLNDVNTKISSQTPQQLGLAKDVKNFDSVYSKNFQKMPVQIIMRVGDDIHDFNDNFTKKGSNQFQHEFLNDKDIRNLIKNPSPRISFKEINNQLIKNYFAKNLAVDNHLIDKNYIQKIEYVELNFNPHEVYVFISGNSMYGGWFNQFGNDFTKMHDSINKYYEQNKGQEIFNVNL